MFGSQDTRNSAIHQTQCPSAEFVHEFLSLVAKDNSY